nr:hypothetical protein [Microbacterium yannicii]
MPGVDGVLATPDILDDLVMLGALEEKVAVSSLDPAGPADAPFVTGNGLTSSTVRAVREARLDMAKLSLCIDLADARTAALLERAGRVVTEASQSGLRVLIEIISTRRGDPATEDDEAEALMRSVSIAAGLGGGSAASWLLLPAAGANVLAATTLPVLLRKTERDAANGAVGATAASAAHHGVCGRVVDASVLFPRDGDFLRSVGQAVSTVQRVKPR